MKIVSKVIQSLLFKQKLSATRIIGKGGCTRLTTNDGKHGTDNFFLWSCISIIIVNYDNINVNLLQEHRGCVGMAQS